MATPTQTQARSSQAQLSGFVTAALLAIRELFRRKAPLPEVANTVAVYQIVAARAGAATMAGWLKAAPTLNPQVFGGVSAYGFPVLEPIIATIDARVPAPVEAIPAPWWSDAAEFMAAVEQLIATEIADSYRTASQVEMIGRGHQNYVRMLRLPSCKRCAVLAGRIYRDLDTFDRHEGCDCVMVPVQDWGDAERNGLVVDGTEAAKNGQIRGLSEADLRAIQDGADLGQIVNATRGTRQPGITNALTTELFGRRVKATTHGTTKRSAWRKANPTRLVRLRPESIYQFATDAEDAKRLLRLYGYLTS